MFSLLDAWLSVYRLVSVMILLSFGKHHRLVLVISSLVHTNTTPERCTCVYCCFLRHVSVVLSTSSIAHFSCTCLYPVRRLKVLENRLLRSIFGPKRDEVARGWIKLHNEELNDVYSAPSIMLVIILRRMRWAGRIARMGERIDVYRILVGKLEGKTTWNT